MLSRMTAAGAPIVSTTELHRRFGEGEAAVHALRGVTLTFPAGEFTAIMGPSGSGKSTLMHLLAGLDRPTSGSVIVDGLELAGLDDRRLTDLRRDKLGFVFQAFNLVPVLTARGEHHAADHARRPQAGPGVVRHAGGHRRPARPADPPPVGAVGRPAAARGRRARPDRAPRGGLRRRADRQPGLGRLLARCSSLLRRAVDEFGQTVIMVTHDAGAAAVADRVVVLRDGEVVHDGASSTAEGLLDLMKQVA